MNFNNIAVVQAATGRPASAARLDRRALTMKEKLLGRAHPDVAITLNNLGMLRAERGRARDAVPLLERAYGAKHTYACAVRENLADVRRLALATAKARR